MALLRLRERLSNMSDTITGRWDQPIIQSKTTAIVVGCIFMACSIVVFHDAYEVRGSNRPFLLRIVGMPQL
jgi:hypothetical protein